MSVDVQVLITGGAGLIGSHLSDRLLHKGARVICVDDFSNSSPTNIEHLFDHPLFSTFRHDITIPLHVETDQIYNLACPASPVHYQKDPVQTIKTNVQGAINMLELAKRLGSRILQASTSEVYGDPAVHPQLEEYWGNVNPIGLRACYAEGKRCAEALFFDYWRQHRVTIRVARIFNTFGPRMRLEDGRVVSKFIVQALLSRELPVDGDGSQTRAFCYVDDLVDGLIALMEFPEIVTGPINLGNPSELSILELARIVIDLTGSRSRIVHRPAPSDNPRRRQPDISIAEKLLGWSPRTTLRDGLILTIHYFEQLLSRTPRSAFTARIESCEKDA